MAAPTDRYVDTALQVQKTVTSLTRSGTTATATVAAHGYVTGNTVKIQGATQAPYNGLFVITRVNVDVFTYTMASDPGASASGAPTASLMAGNGTSGSPFSDLQFALSNTTRDTVNGDRFNLKGTNNVTGNLSLAFYGTPTITAPLVIQGYTSTPDDGGIGILNGDGVNAILNVPSVDYIHLVDLHFRNTGTTFLVNIDDNCLVANCIFENSQKDGLEIGNNGLIINCIFKNITEDGIVGQSGATSSTFIYNYFTGTFVYAMDLNSNDYPKVWGNIISVGGAGFGIRPNTYALLFNNSILSAGGSGSGIRKKVGASEGFAGGTVFNNLVEGFSGTDGYGIRPFGSGISDVTYMNAYNAVFNCETNYQASDHEAIAVNNESPAGSLFSKAGADSEANLSNYYRPAGVGSIRNGSYPFGRAKGAINFSDVIGGLPTDGTPARTVLIGSHFVGN